MARCIILAVVVLLAAQSGQCGVIITALKTLGEQAGDVIDSAHKASKNIADTVEGLANSTINSIEQKAEAFGQSVNASVDALKNAAEEAGQDAENCFLDAPVAIGNVVQNVTADAVACVKEQVQEATDIENTLSLLAAMANTTYETAVQKYRDCQKETEIEKVECVPPVIDDAALKETEILGEVTAEVTKGGSLIANFQTTVDTCELAVWADAPARASAIVLDSIKSCLASSSSAPSLPTTTTTTTPTTVNKKKHSPPTSKQ